MLKVFRLGWVLSFQLQSILGFCNLASKSNCSPSHEPTNALKIKRSRMYFNVQRILKCSTCHFIYSVQLHFLGYRQKPSPFLYSIDIWPARKSRLTQRERNHSQECARLFAWSCLAESCPLYYLK